MLKALGQYVNIYMYMYALVTLKCAEFVLGLFGPL